jgi:hypothetical protein
MTLIPFERRSTKDMLEVIDSLRQHVADGKIVAFACIGIEPDDGTSCWMGSHPDVSQLRMMGAVSQLQWSLHAGDIE